MESVTVRETNTNSGIERSVTEPEKDTEPPQMNDNPLSALEAGTIEAPCVDGWEYTGNHYYSNLNEYLVDWEGEFQVPGYDESEKAIVSVEYTDFCPNEVFEEGFCVTIYPFDGQGEPLSDSMIQESISVGIYKSLRVALNNTRVVLEGLAELEKGEQIVLGGRIYSL